MDHVVRFFDNISEDKAAEHLETIYNAIFIDAKAGKSNTIQGHHYNESSYDYLMRTIGLLTATTITE